MDKIQERLEFARKATKEHDDASSLYNGTDSHNKEKANNAEREEQGKFPIIHEIYRPNNQSGYEGEENLTSSARKAFWATAGDGRIEDEGRPEVDDYILADSQYEGRPDIESRESILRRYGQL